MTSQHPPVSLSLNEKQIPHELFVHTGSVTSLEQAAAERGQKPEQIIRSLLFRVNKGEYVMVLVAGPAQINWKTLRRELGQSRLTTASREEVKQVTGYEIGAVAPFGLPQPVPVLVDKTVLASEILSLGSGIRGTAVILRRDDLLTALGDVQIVDLM